MANVLGVDVSHWQGTVDWPAVRAAGHDFAIVKATESTTYTDPTFAANRARAHAAGLTVGLYHFARATDPVAEADYFVSRVAPLAAGEFVVLDWEVSHPAPPTWCLAWLERVTARLGVRPLIYMNQSTANAWKWKQVVTSGHPLWLAKYDQKLDDPGPVGDWSKVAMKQHSDRGSVPGISGATDLNVFFGDKAALNALAQSGNPETPPTSEEDDMKPLFIAAPGRGYALVWPGFTKWLPGGPAGQEELDAAIAEFGPAQMLATRDFDVRVALRMNTSMSGQAIADITTSVAKTVSGADVDETALGQAVVTGLLPQLTAALAERTGATREDVEAAVRAVFADAAS